MNPSATRSMIWTALTECAVLTESGSLAQPIVQRQVSSDYRQYVEAEAWSSLWGIVKFENICIAKGVLADMLKVALCDDNHNVVHKYAELLTAIADKHKVDIQLSCFYSGESMLFHICDAPEQMDIIYLDIMMDQMDGMETARKLRDYGCNAQIIFLTSSEGYVFGAFDVHALQYLLKEDISTDKFEAVFLNVYN